MNVYLPIAEMSVNVLVLLLFGAAGGFMSGLFGLGGGFLVTPLLAFIGVPPSIAVGTQANQLVGTSLAGTLAHWRRRNIDIRMGLVMLVGGLAGSTCGAEIFKWLQKVGHIDVAIKLSYVALLGGTGIMVMVESSRRLLGKTKSSLLKAKTEQSAHSSSREKILLWGANSRIALDFPVSQLRINALIPAGIGFVGGMLLSLLGIGGFFLIPAMIYILRMPPRLVSGTSLFQIIFTMAYTTILQAAINKSVDVILAMILVAGGVIGAPLGARLAARINPVWARFFFALLILAVSTKLLIDLTITPGSFFTLETRPL